MSNEKERVLMMWNDGGWDGGSWLAMLLMLLVVGGALAVLVIWLIGTGRNGSTRARADQAWPMASVDEVLVGRFARGEIDEDEFTRRCELLHTVDGRS